MKLIKFSADWCGYCKGMERAKTVDKFIAEHPDVELVNYHNADEGDEADKMMEHYDVDGMPAFVWEDDEGNVIHMEAGATSLSGLKKQYKQALAGLESGTYGKDPLPKKSRRKK